MYWVLILRLIEGGLNGRWMAEINWRNIEVDHVKPICMFDVSKDLREAFCWKNTCYLKKIINIREQNLIS